MNLTLSDNPDAELSAFSAGALRTLHRLLCCTRSEAYLGMEAKRIGDILDTAEYLAQLILNEEKRGEEERAREFRLLLEGLQTAFPGFDDHLLTFFDNSLKQSPNNESEMIHDRHQARVAV